MILLINPKIKNIAQKNSAKIANCKETAGPKPIGSAKLLSLSLKWITLDQPWETNIRETPTLKRSRPKSKTNGLFEKTIFFMNSYSTINLKLISG